MSEPKVLLTDLGIPESPRWREGRLWFCNWIERRPARAVTVCKAAPTDGVS